MKKNLQIWSDIVSRWSSHCLIPLITSSLLLLSRFEGTHTSKREIMTPLQPHLRLNADACLRDAACHLYYCSQPIRVWVFGSVASKEERAPVHWINGVNNSLWRFSDYAQTEWPHSTGRQTKTAQSTASTQKTNQYTPKNKPANTGESSIETPKKLLSYASRNSVQRSGTYTDL